MDVVHVVRHELKPSVGANHYEAEKEERGPHHDTVSKVSICFVPIWSWISLEITEVREFVSIALRMSALAISSSFFVTEWVTCCV